MLEGIPTRFDKSSEYRGLVNYYRMATNLNLLGQLKWVMEQSLLMTLAGKYRTSVRKVSRRFRTTHRTAEKSFRAIKAVTIRGPGKKPLVAYWGGISLRRHKHAFLNDRPPLVWNNSRSDLEQRLLADACEMCGSTDHVQVHHVRALRDLRRKGRSDHPDWVVAMASRQRKTLVVCRQCHAAIHHGQPLALTSRNWSLESRMIRNDHARFGGGPLLRALMPPTRASLPI